MEKLLEIDQLTKVFSFGSMISRVKITATDNVSFYVKPAEIFALAGESGCGKSTTARIVLGFEKPTSGTIVHNGERAKKNEKVWFTRGIQAIFQDPFGTFNPLRLVDRYFFETVQHYKLAKNKQAAIDLIDQKLKAVGLSYEEFAGKYPSEFSGGQLQRISVARALLTDPTLLIADEPVSMVDASTRMSILNILMGLKKKFEMSIVYVTHDLDTAYYVSDQIAVMNRGWVVEYGDVEDVLTNPLHPYTQLLLKCLPEPDPTRRWQDQIELAGLEVKEYETVGCKFSRRCPSAEERCLESQPPVVKMKSRSGYRFVKCCEYVKEGV